MRAREIARRLRAFLDDPRDTSWGDPLSDLAERAMRAVAAGDPAAQARRLAELAIALAPMHELGPCGALMLEALNWRLPEDQRVQAAEKLWKLLMQTPPDVAGRLDKFASVYAAISDAHRKRVRSQQPGIATERFERDLRRQLFQRLRQRARDESSKAADPERAPQDQHGITPEDLAVGLADLTPRERELAMLISDGKTIIEAAAALGIKESTATRLFSRLRTNIG